MYRITPTDPPSMWITVEGPGLEHSPQRVLLLPSDLHRTRVDYVYRNRGSDIIQSGTFLPPSADEIARIMVPRGLDAIREVNILYPGEGLPSALPSDATQVLPKVTPPPADDAMQKEIAWRLLDKSAGLKRDVHGESTPERFVSMLNELTECKECNGSCIKWKTFPTESDEMIIVDNIPFVSVCNHHVITFYGVVHIAYVPGAYIAGLSKFARVVHHFARQLQVQERLTGQIAKYLEQELKPAGVGVIIRAEHLCMTIRGVQVPGTRTTTSAMRGVFADHERTAKSEFLAMLRNNH